MGQNRIFKKDDCLDYNISKKTQIFSKNTWWLTPAVNKILITY